MPRPHTLVILGAAVSVLLFGAAIGSDATAGRVAEPRKGGTYSGKTSQGLPVLVKVSPDGKKVLRFRLSFRPRCSQVIAGSVKLTLDLVPDFFKPLPIRNGGFDSHNAIAPIKGTFSSALLATGTVRIPQGNADTCGSFTLGATKWSARLLS